MRKGKRRDEGEPVKKIWRQFQRKPMEEVLRAIKILPLIVSLVSEAKTR